MKLTKPFIKFFPALRSIFGVRFRGFAALLAFSFLLVCLSPSLQAETIELYDHGTAPCYLYDDQNRADWTSVHVTVVTGTVWTQDNSSYSDVRMRDASGNRIYLGATILISPGTPAGTIVGQFDYVQTYPFCYFGLPNPMIYG